MYVLSGINNEFVEIEMIEINKIKKRCKKYNYFWLFLIVLFSSYFTYIYRFYYYFTLYYFDL